MRTALIIILLFAGIAAFSQDGKDVVNTMKRFHVEMTKEKPLVEKYLDDSLSYGHSNGWVENRKEFFEDLGHKIVYHSVKEDSIKVSVNGAVAHIRFIADADVSLEGKRNIFHLKVLEVWVKRENEWRLFARQAVR